MFKQHDICAKLVTFFFSEILQKTLQLIRFLKTLIRNFPQHLTSLFNGISNRVSAEISYSPYLF